MTHGLAPRHLGTGRLGDYEFDDPCVVARALVPPGGWSSPGVPLQGQGEGVATAGVHHFVVEHCVCAHVCGRVGGIQDGKTENENTLASGYVIQNNGKRAGGRSDRALGADESIRIILLVEVGEDCGGCRDGVDVIPTLECSRQREDVGITLK